MPDQIASTPLLAAGAAADEALAALGAAGFAQVRRQRAMAGKPVPRSEAA